MRSGEEKAVARRLRPVLEAPASPSKTPANP
jgi:hypothetical protein